MTSKATHTSSVAPRSDCVSRETAERLDCYVAALLRWNRTINLVSRRDESDIWERHVADCLQLAKLIPHGTTHAIDLGSGAGLPGLVLAIATGIPFHLIEADQRKAAFLREAGRLTAAPITVHAGRIERLRLPSAPLVTARACAPLATLLAWAAPLLAADGICLFPKGRTADSELTSAALQWHMRVETLRSRTDADSRIFRISDISRFGPDG